MRTPRDKSRKREWHKWDKRAFDESVSKYTTGEFYQQRSEWRKNSARGYNSSYAQQHGGMCRNWKMFRDCFGVYSCPCVLSRLLFCIFFGFSPILCVPAPMSKFLPFSDGHDEGEKRANKRLSPNVCSNAKCRAKKEKKEEGREIIHANQLDVIYSHRVYLPIVLDWIWI